MAKPRVYSGKWDGLQNATLTVWLADGHAAVLRGRAEVGDGVLYIIRELPPSPSTEDRHYYSHQYAPGAWLSVRTVRDDEPFGEVSTDG